MATKMISLDNTEFDLNSLFNFQHNYDLLKRIIEVLAKNQKVTQQKLIDIEIIVAGKDKEIEGLEKQISQILMNTDKRFKNIENLIIKTRKEIGASSQDNTRDIMETTSNPNNFSSNNNKTNNQNPEKKRDKTENNNTSNTNDNRNQNNSSLISESNINTTNQELQNGGDDKLLNRSNEFNKGSKIENQNNIINITNTSDIINERVVLREQDIVKDKRNDNTDINGSDRFITEDNKLTKNSAVYTNLYGELETQDFISKLVKRIMKLEKEMLECSKVNNEVYEIKGKTSVNQNEIAQNGSEIRLMKEKLEDLISKNGLMSENIEQLNVKILDFNIYDLFKNASAGGTVDAGVLLVKNLDDKVFQKFSLIDKKLKLVEEDNYKNKGDINNIKNIQDGQNRIITNNKDEINKFSDDLNHLEEEFKNSSTNLENSINENNNKIINILNDNVNALKNLLKEKDDLIKATEDNIASEMNKSKGNTGGFSDNDAKILREMNKRVTELDKTFKLFNSTINIEFIKSELSRLSDGLNTKVSIGEYHDLRENSNQLTYQINFMKDTLSQIMEDRKMLDDVNWLRKKVESLTSTVLSLKNAEDTNGSLQIKGIPIDTSKYLELNIFTEFQKGYNRELDGLRRDTDELKRYMDDIIAALKTKSSDRDLKNLEEYLVTKMEELRLNSNKKFADKSDTQKNIKYIDAQVKHIIDVYIKKMEKGDNWLIAKKPVNGYTCASCEGYIGDLQDKTNEYVPWNKYPIRDPNDKAYRIGNGFSRMLQMLNVDIKKSNDQQIPHQFTEAVNIGEGSDDDLRRSHSNYGKKEIILPNVLNQASKPNLNMTMDSNKGETDEDKRFNTETFKPKIVKIYKKSKQQNEGKTEK